MNENLIGMYVESAAGRGIVESQDPRDVSTYCVKYYNEIGRPYWLVHQRKSFTVSSDQESRLKKWRKVRS